MNIVSGQRRGVARSGRANSRAKSNRMDKSNQQGDSTILLDLLTAVERDSALTQRSLSQDLGIALGLANAYLKRCVSKGLIKVRQAPLNRYAYYLTPGGFAEKSRLTAEYLTISFNLFRDARRQCAEILADCAAHSFRRVALVGDGDLAEVAVLSAGEFKVDIVCVIDDDSVRQQCIGRPVVSDLAAAQKLCGSAGLDALIVTDMISPQATFDAVSALDAGTGMSIDRVFVLGILRIRTNAKATQATGDLP